MDINSILKPYVIDLRSTMLKNPDPAIVYKERRLSNIGRIVLHCDVWDTDVWTIARYDVTPNPKHHISVKGCPGFTYHFFVEKDGSIAYCEDLTKITWHAGNWNGGSIGICMRYNPTGNLKPPPAEQINSTILLMKTLCLELGIDPDNIQGHRELLGTGYVVVDGVKKLRKTCPGMLVNMDNIRYTVGINVQTVLKYLGLYQGKIDGMFGQKSEAALAQYTKQKG